LDVHLKPFRKKYGNIDIIKRLMISTISRTAVSIGKAAESGMCAGRRDVISAGSRAGSARPATAGARTLKIFRARSKREPPMSVMPV
jgi:hypothetical protein